MTPHEEHFPRRPDGGNGWRIIPILFGVAAIVLIGIVVLTNAI